MLDPFVLDVLDTEDLRKSTIVQTMRFMHFFRRVHKVLRSSPTRSTPVDQAPRHDELPIGAGDLDPVAQDTVGLPGKRP